MQVLIGRMVRLSIEATAGAGGGEDGEESTSKNHLLNPFGAEELFDQALGMMASVNTCAEVFVILNAVIVCVSDPAAGFIDRAIKTAEVWHLRCRFHHQTRKIILYRNCRL